ncbi:MAG: hypothetical protein IAI48_06760, partial [Candidatus Eremiobacteraeota bacterium]|nr:hypothetical protein [Candidatus Eremiobacteraeota bacterium]
SPDVDAWRPDAPVPGATLPSARVTRDGDELHLGDALGTRPLAIVYGTADLPDAERAGIDVVRVWRDDDPGARNAGAVVDRFGSVRTRLDLADGGVYLVRPDGHVAARRRDVDADTLVPLVRRLEGAHAAPA